MTFDESLDALTATITSYPGDALFMVPDIVLYNYALDVHEHGHAVKILAASAVPRAALTNARSALESALDALYLTASVSEYATRGARARVAELFEGERVHRRADLTDTTTPGASAELEEAIIKDAEQWNESAPGQGLLLTREWERLSRNPGRIGDHWSGHSRMDLYRDVLGQIAGAEDLTRALDVIYAVLSIGAHPKPRTGAREVSLTAPDELTYSSRASDGEHARGVAELAVAFTLRSLQRRRNFVIPVT